MMEDTLAQCADTLPGDPLDTAAAKADQGGKPQQNGGQHQTPRQPGFVPGYRPDQALQEHRRHHRCGGFECGKQARAKKGKGTVNPSENSGQDRDAVRFGCLLHSILPPPGAA